jgi:hypothetical protein
LNIFVCEQKVEFKQIYEQILKFGKSLNQKTIQNLKKIEASKTTETQKKTKNRKKKPSEN